MLSVEELYTQFCLTNEVERHYMSEELDYILAFDEWIQDLTAEELDDVTEEELKKVKEDVYKFVDEYLIQKAYVKPIN